MMQKNERQGHIRQLIQAEMIERQGDLVDRLNALGIPVTQATISRDIKDMQLVKVPTGTGHYRYSLPPEKQLAPLEKLRRTFGASYRSGETMAYFVALNMDPGTAPAIGTLIEQLRDARIFTVIAGDSTILIICHSAAQAVQLLAFFDEIAG